MDLPYNRGFPHNLCVNKVLLMLSPKVEKKNPKKEKKRKKKKEKKRKKKEKKEKKKKKEREWILSSVHTVHCANDPLSHLTLKQFLSLIYPFLSPISPWPHYKPNKVHSDHD